MHTTLQDQRHRHRIRRLATVAATLAIACASAPALAVNKCTGPAGQITFQDAPCTGQGGAVVVRPATGAGPAQPAGGVTEAQRINAAIDRSAAARRVVDLDALLIPRTRQALANLHTRCTQQRAALERSQYAYRQNLYGKTHAAQIASELVQLTLDCDREEKSLTRDLRSLERERDQAAASSGPTQSGTNTPPAP